MSQPRAAPIRTTRVMPRVTDDRVSADALSKAIARAWARQTSADPAGWSAANPAWGQCAVTALIVQDFFGGELFRCEVNSISHYWNRLASGKELDLTGHQFGNGFRASRGESRTRAYVMSFPDTAARYRRLSASTRRALQRLVPLAQTNRA